MSKLIFAKLDPGFFSNPKVLKAGRDGRDVFLHVICVNASRGAPGWIPSRHIEPWVLRRELDMTEEQAVTAVTRAVGAELIRIDTDRVEIVGWEEEWGRRALTDAERQKNRRARVKSHESGVTESRPGHAVTDQRRSEEIRERGSLSVSRETPSAARGARQQPIPAAWQPTTAAADFARERRLDVKHEAEQFRLWAKADGKTFADPDAAFMKFMRGSRDIGKPPKPGATTRAPRPERVQVDGAWFEDDGEGNLRPVAQSKGESA